MNGWRYVVGKGISAIYGATKRISGKGGGAFRVLMYHALGTPVPQDIRSMYSIKLAAFVAQMEIIADLYAGKIVPLSQLPDDGIAVTFDDGYLDNLHTAAPVLERLHIPFTVFVNPTLVRSGSSIYLSPSALRELACVPGAAIGAHGYTHCRLADCDDDKLRIELVDSRKWLEDILGRAVTSMSYPNGSVDARVRKAVVDAGYTIAASSRAGANFAGYDPIALARTGIWTQDDLSAFQAKIRGYWDWQALVAK